ncbi:hypothetical protein Tco_1556925 [Tanacetum coccineum]
MGPCGWPGSVLLNIDLDADQMYLSLGLNYGSSIPSSVLLNAGRSDVVSFGCLVSSIASLLCILGTCVSDEGIEGVLRVVHLRAPACDLPTMNSWEVTMINIWHKVRIGTWAWEPRDQDRQSAVPAGVNYEAYTP